MRKPILIFGFLFLALIVLAISIPRLPEKSNDLDDLEYIYGEINAVSDQYAKEHSHPAKTIDELNINEKLLKRIAEDSDHSHLSQKYQISDLNTQNVLIIKAKKTSSKCQFNYTPRLSKNYIPSFMGNCTIDNKTIYFPRT